jgi:hypothetical protein
MRNEMHVSEQTEEGAEITNSYGDSHNTSLIVSATMPTAIETAVMRTAVMSARINRVTAVKTSLVSLCMMRLAVRVLTLTPSCVLDRTTLSRRTGGACSGGGSFAVDQPFDQQSREGFPPLGIWPSHEMPDQATYTRKTYDAEDNPENREHHDPTLLLLENTARKAMALKEE